MPLPEELIALGVPLKEVFKHTDYTENYFGVIKHYNKYNVVALRSGNISTASFVDLDDLVKCWPWEHTFSATNIKEIKNFEYLFTYNPGTEDIKDAVYNYLKDLMC